MTIVEGITDSVIPPSETKKSIKKFEGFNTFFGVYLPSVLSIFGVILYLRLGFVLGEIGIYKMIVIICISSAITFITALSISATATNMDVKSGGAYYMISRSFGVEIGSAIGLALFLAQVVGIAFYIEGFSESVRFVFPSINPVVIETFAISFIAILTYTSSDIALKAQFVILLIIITSLLSFFTGKAAVIDPDNVSQLSLPISFWAAFALYFPAVTGIEAGFSMSGELKDPRRSLPIGSLLAVSTGLIGYLIITTFLWNKVPVETLRSDPMVFFNVSRIKGLALMGVWGATLSCSIGGFLGAPRTLQALAKDSIVSKFLGKGYGVNNEPRIATVFTFFLALFCLYFGDINILAPVLTMFFLITYGMLNLAAGLESLFGNPSWRPSFVTSSAVSLVGAFLCFMAMLMIDAGVTVIAIAIIVIFYQIIKRKSIGGGWEDIRQGGLLFFCRFAIYRLSALGPSVRSWRPYFLVFSSSPTQKGSIIDFAHSITKDKGFLTITSIITANDMDNAKILRLEQLIKDYLHKRKIQSLIELEKAEDYYAGMKKMITTYGLGPITPNTIVFGCSTKNSTFTKEAEVISVANDLHRNVIILKDDGEFSEGTIDIWWDENYKLNAELMILLAHMLSDTPRWKKCKVNLKCIVQSEMGREQRMKYFEDLFSRSRLRIDVKVLVVPDEETVSLRTISKFSSSASFVFLGLRPPKKDEEIESYGSYIKELMNHAKDFRRLAYVLCTEKVELNKLFD